MKPALTAEEWAEFDNGEAYVRETESEFRTPLGFRFDAGSASENIEDPHGVAALCLYGQPFGFTMEDVEALRYEAEYATNGSQAVRLFGLADRIEALLPPEDNHG